VEIKHGSAPKLGKHYSATCDDVGADRKYIVYGGDDEFPIGKGVHMLSLPRLMHKILTEGHFWKPPMTATRAILILSKAL
jgi:hypothetical protein